MIVAAGVIGWYLQNEETGADGERGILALRPDAKIPQPKARSRYSIKPRKALRARDRATVESVKAAREPASSYRAIDEAERMRRKFRRQDDARYRVKDRKADYTPPER